MTVQFAFGDIDGFEILTSMRHILRLVIFSILIAALTTASAVAQEDRASNASSSAAGARTDAANGTKRTINAEVLSVLTRARTGSPMPFEWKLTYEGKGLLEGRLVYSVFDDDKLIARFEGDDMALTVGEQRYSAVLPAMTLKGVLSQATLMAEFVTKNERLPLRENILLVPAQDQRTLTLGMVGGPTSPTRDEQDLVDSMRLESFRPDNNVAKLVTVLTYFTPANVFTDPLRFCGFDVVVLSGSGFSGLTEKQLDALLKWVDAGGSVCVAPGGSLAARHINFLNELTELEPNKEVFVADATGKLMLGADEAAAAPRMFRRGLGRCVIYPPGANGSHDVSTAAWRKGVAFLWKARPDQLKAMSEGKKWVNPPRQEPIYGRFYRQPNYGPPQTSPSIYADYTLHVRQFASMPGLVSAIKPRNVEAVPISVIGVTLLLYVLAVGPVEYFVLGKLKLRRLTWVIFPVVTVAFTVFALSLSQWYLGSNDTRRALEIVDVGTKGSVIRSSRYEMLFSSLARTIETDVRQALFTPIALDAGDDFINMASGNFGTGFGDSQRSNNPPVFVGRVPSHHTVRQPVQQWTPQINRLFTIAPEVAEDAEHLKFDWDRPLENQPAANGSKALIERVHAAFGQDASVCVMIGNELWTLTDPKRLAFHLTQQTVPRNFPEDNDRRHNFLEDSCKAEGTGLFSVVSHISPTGGDNFEDLAVFDAADPTQTLLVILVEHEGTLRMYRKLYF